MTTSKSVSSLSLSQVGADINVEKYVEVEGLAGVGAATNRASGYIATNLLAFPEALPRNQDQGNPNPLITGPDVKRFDTTYAVPPGML